MKFFFSISALLLSASLCNADPLIHQAFQAFRAEKNLNAAIAKFQAGDMNAQPTCVHKSKNYVTCVDLPEDVDDTHFLSHPVVSSDLTLGSLKGLPDYKLGLGFLEALREKAMTCDLDITESATFRWFSGLDGFTPVTAKILVKDFEAVSGFGDSEVEIWNTFSDDHATGGAQVVYDYSSATANTDLEFPGFPMNMPPMEGGFYDIDVSANTITYTLVDNRSATNLVFPAETFDRYYIIMDAPVTSVEVLSSDSIVAVADIMEPGSSEETVDFFGTGLVFPESFGDNVIRVQIIEGTDLTELGQHIVLSYTLEQDTASYVCGSHPVIESFL